MIYYFVWIVIVLIIWIYLWLFYKLNKKLKKYIKDDLLKRKEKIIKAKISNKEKIIDLDKLYHKVLLVYGYKWTFWEILKQNPKEIKDINKIWELHKLRNKLVHDFDLVSEWVLQKKVKLYEKEIEKLLN